MKKTKTKKENRKWKNTSFDVKYRHRKKETKKKKIQDEEDQDFLSGGNLLRHVVQAHSLALNSSISL